MVDERKVLVTQFWTNGFKTIKQEEMELSWKKLSAVTKAVTSQMPISSLLIGFT